MDADVIVVGGGLAGSEAAWQAAEQGVSVVLREMRPVRSTPAHRTDRLAELVCSNSLRGADLANAVGLLKEEMRRAGSLIMSVADGCTVPAGAAQAVDRDAFAAGVTERILGHRRIRVERREVDALPAGPTVAASGPLTSEPLAAAIEDFVGQRHLAFFDAAAPVVSAESIDWSQVYSASRYGRGEGADYVNCPMDRPAYDRFYQALLAAEPAPREGFDPVPFFEGCLPVEEMARRGRDTLRFGPMKPVGLADPRTGRPPYAVVQLRRENRAGTLYNLVGFQTSLRWGEQRRVLRLIPGLEAAEFERYGVMHRNIFLNAPAVLLPTLQTRRRADLLFAGQITGVEGYVESAATGIVAGLNAARLASGRPPLTWPADTMVGSLCRHVACTDPAHFQPMNAAFGLVGVGPAPVGPTRGSRRERRLAVATRALESLGAFLGTHGLGTRGTVGGTPAETPAREVRA